MQRNLLSVGHLILLSSTLITLSGCMDMTTRRDWSPATGTLPTQNGEQIPVTDASLAAPTKAVTDISKVSILLPLTGKGAETGRAMLNASQLAMFDMNASSVFELRPEDTGRGANQAISNAIANKTNFIIGPVFSSDTKEVTPVALQNGLNVISFSTDMTAAVGNTFLMGFMPQAQVNSVLSYANSVGLKRIALIAPRDVYGDSVASSYLIFMQRYALDHAGIIRTNPNTLPTIADIEKLKTGVDAVLIATSAIESHKISNLLTDAGLPPSAVKRLGTGLWDQPDATKLSGLQGAWYAASSPRLRTRFEHRYFETYGEQPPRLASLAYDATALAVVLAKSGQGFGRQTLTNPNGFSGVDGIFRFTSEGIADRGLAILEIKNGAANILMDAPQRFGSR